MFVPLHVFRETKTPNGKLYKKRSIIPSLVKKENTTFLKFLNVVILIPEKLKFATFAVIGFRI